MLKAADNQQKALFTAIVGNGIDLAKIFNKSEYSPEENREMPKKASFKYGMDADKFDSIFATIENELTPQEAEVIILGKVVYEAITLYNILTAESLSASMIKKFESHKQQLEALKRYAKSVSREFYDSLFVEKGLYTNFIEGVEGKPVSRDDFYESLKKILQPDEKKKKI